MSRIFKRSEPPLALTCPAGGEEWPTTSFKCTVDATYEVQRPSTIHFVCPTGHCFTLAKAMRSKMFTREEAKRMIANAQKSRDRYSEAKSFGEIEQVLEDIKNGRF